MLHSVSALFVQACEMRQIVTRVLYSVTRGGCPYGDERKISLSLTNNFFFFSY